MAFPVPKYPNKSRICKYEYNSLSSGVAMGAFAPKISRIEHIIYIYERATLARAPRIVIHSIFVLGPSALGMGKSYL